VRRLNEIRRGSEPLQRIDVRFLDTANEALIAYVKGQGEGAIIICVNLDPHSAQEGLVILPSDLDLPDAFTARDLVSGEAFPWGVGGNYVRLDPALAPMHVLRVEP
jgi:starch synthase (maltosyl-transferring)